MVKLSQQHIAFIDRYLENSGVIYADIRVEMVDHIASDVEAQMGAGDSEGFYAIFKEYMVQHKQQLLKNKQKVIYSTTKKMTINVLNRLLSWKFGIVFVLFVLVFLHSLSDLGPVITSQIYLFSVLGIGLVPALFYRYGIHKRHIARLAAIECLAVSYGILLQVMYVLHFCIPLIAVYLTFSEWLFSVLFAFTAVFSLAFIGEGLALYKIQKQNKFMYL